jgi:hypothetical protein
MIFVVGLVLFAVMVFGARIATRILFKNVWVERLANLLLLMLPPILLALAIFPPNSGGGLGFVLLVPLLWAAGFAAIIAGGLVDLNRRT